jgi:hypothetical protein
MTHPQLFNGLNFKSKSDTTKARSLTHSISSVKGRVGALVSQPHFWKSVRMTLTLSKWGLRSPKISECNCKGQNTLPWCVLYIIGKLSKCRCRKWPRTSHLDIYNTSYGKKKGRKSNWLSTTKSQELTRPWCVQVECDTPSESSQGELQVYSKPHPNWRFEQKVMNLQSPESLNQDNFGTPPWESRDKKSFGCVPWRDTENTIWGKVVASLESGLWWVLWV